MNRSAGLSLLYSLILVIILPGCGESTSPVSSESRLVPDMTDNLINSFSTEDPGEFQWVNEPMSFKVENGVLTIVAEKGTDFFNNPEDSSRTATAPYFFREITGDFVATALVRPDFSDQWNAVALMLHIDENHWIKYAFENSDATGKSIVSVVTKGVSDDANGVRLNDQDQVWLRMIRKGELYSMLWSLDGETYKMTRLTRMPEAEHVRIGIEAQSPVGEPITHEIRFFGIERKTVEDMRKGE